jgi:hypothetical protein
MSVCNVNEKFLHVFGIEGSVVLLAIAFAKLQKSDNYLHHVCPPVHMVQLGSHWTDLNEI